MQAFLRFVLQRARARLSGTAERAARPGWDPWSPSAFLRSLGFGASNAADPSGIRRGPTAPLASGLSLLNGVSEQELLHLHQAYEVLARSFFVQLHGDIFWYFPASPG